MLTTLSPKLRWAAGCTTSSSQLLQRVGHAAVHRGGLAEGDGAQRLDLPGIGHLAAIALVDVADLLGQPDARRLHLAGAFRRPQALGVETGSCWSWTSRSRPARPRQRRRQEACAGQRSGTRATQLTGQASARLRRSGLTKPQLTEVKARHGAAGAMLPGTCGGMHDEAQISRHGTGGGRPAGCRRARGRGRRRHHRHAAGERGHQPRTRPAATSATTAPPAMASTARATARWANSSRWRFRT